MASDGASPIRERTQAVDQTRRLRRGARQRVRVLRFRGLRHLRGDDRPRLLPDEKRLPEPPALGRDLRRRLRHPPARRHPDRRLCRPQRPQARAHAHHRADGDRQRRDRHPAHLSADRHRGAAAAGSRAADPGLLDRGRDGARHHLPARGRAARPPGAVRQLAVRRPGHGEHRRRPGRLPARPLDVGPGAERLGLAHPVPARHPDRPGRHLYPQATRRDPRRRRRAQEHRPRAVAHARRALADAWCWRSR